MKKQHLRKLQFKFPKIYRFFTDRKLFRKQFLPWLSWLQPHTKNKYLQLLFFGMVYLSFLAPLAIVGANVYDDLQTAKYIEKQRQELLLQVQFWQGIIKTHENYRDAYMQLSFLEYQLKNENLAYEYLQKALLLDPNYKEGRDLETIVVRRLKIENK